MSKGDLDTVEKLLQENRGLREENSSLREKIIANEMKALDSKSDIKENGSAMSHEKIPIPARMHSLYLVDKILTKLDLSKDCYFLDIWCGTGEFVLKMAKLGYK